MNRFLSSLFVLFFVPTCLTSLVNAQVVSPQRPHLPRLGENMIGNAAIESKSEWTLLRGAMVDPATSSSQDDSGSIKLVAPVPKHSMAVAKLVAVKKGQRYTFGFHFKTQNGPTYVGGQISLHDKNRKYLRNLTSTWGGTTADDTWQEYALPFVVPEGVAFVGCQVFKGPSTKEGGLVWADDFYLGCLLYTSPSPRDQRGSRMPSSA